MEIQHLPPLAIHFIWNIADNTIVDKILDHIKINFARNVEFPYSRGLNIPLFFYNSNNPIEPPKDYPTLQAEKDIIYVFTSINTLINNKFLTYLNHLPSNKNFIYIPIALDCNALNHSEYASVLHKKNFIRVYEIGFDDMDKILLTFSHELYRWGFRDLNNNEPSKNTSIKLFLSHCKIGERGKSVALKIKDYLNNTNMNSFFDATEISPGIAFDKDIENNLKDATILAIESDDYYSRYWCQKEILVAKQENRPILVIDCLDSFEDRIFPFGANVPCVSTNKHGPISDKSIIVILLSAILETIRNNYSLKLLQYYKYNKWIDSDCVLLSRPPEAIQIKSWNDKGLKKFCYPEPPLYRDELDFFIPEDIKVFTPLWDKESSCDSFDNLRIGISISDFSISRYSKFHMNSESLKRLSQDVARHLISRQAKIVYGGDLRKDGFTRYILDEALVVKNRMQCIDSLQQDKYKKYVENHLAWPIYVDLNSEIKLFYGDYNLVLDTVEEEIPDDIIDLVDIKNFLSPNSLENRYIWSRSLTHMRERIIDSTDYRICAGGKLNNYKGKMPGVLEEIILAIKKDKPLFLLGAYGGVVKEVCKTILNKSITEPLTEKWQNEHNVDYCNLQIKASFNNNNADYENIKNILETLSIQNLAKNVGLTLLEYKRLMNSPFSDECIHLILKGIQNKINN
ncbi:MAG: TIR domain-containing protein [Sphaerochaetaceae bacterium]|nr:TIR domain-containing protein [Sphaerochaetaceae bacterium]